MRSGIKILPNKTTLLQNMHGEACGMAINYLSTYCQCSLLPYFLGCLGRVNSIQLKPIPSAELKRGVQISFQIQVGKFSSIQAEVSYQLPTADRIKEKALSQS